MKKSILFILFTLLLFITKAQDVCIDSSTHYRFSPLLSDSFSISKQILLKDSSKVIIGNFYYYRSGTNPRKSFVGKVNKNGKVVWFKTLDFPYTQSGAASLQGLHEAGNGNIFITIAATQTDDRPFFFIVLSPGGNLLKQVKLGFSNIIGLGDTYNRAPLAAALGADSVILGFHFRYNISDFFSIITTDLEGNIGQQFFLQSPPATTVSSYYDHAVFNNNRLYLYGSGDFYNSCSYGSGEQTKYYMVEMNWPTKTVITKKAYCNPLFGSYWNYWSVPIDEHTFSTNHNVFYLANGNIIYTRTAMGLEIKGTDTVNRMFSVSEFDRNFNHVKSEYITTGNQFKRNAYYDIYIDSFNNRHIRVHDMAGKYIYYAVGDKNNKYYLQKRIPLVASAEEYRLFIRQPFLEPGYFTTFNMLSIYNGRTNIDNFRILTIDTANNCFGENSPFLSTRLAAPTPINWNGDFTIANAVLDAITPNISLQNYDFRSEIICNTVSVCDTIKLHATDTICDISKKVVITAYKNPLCRGKINFLFDTSSMQSFEQTNDTTLQLTFNESYTGKVYAQPANCHLLKDSINLVVIAPAAAINLGVDKMFCPGKSYLLNAYNPQYRSYKWQNNTTDSVLVATTPGTYYVTAKDICNRVYTDTIEIVQPDLRMKIEMDTTICKGEVVRLTATSGFQNYLWQPTINLTMIADNIVDVQPDFTTNYIVTAEKFTGCFSKDTVEVRVKDCPQSINFPNAFTPNDDGLNDKFRPVITGKLKFYELIVYNRWGQVVFKTTNSYTGWNGKTKDQIISGIYTWICKYQFENQSSIVKKGIVMVLK